MRRGGISRARVAYDLLQDSPNRVICTRRAAAALAHRAARIRRPAWLLDAEQAFLFAVRSRASGLRGIGVACRVMGSRHSVRCRRRAGQCCWRDGESRLVRAVVVPKHSCGPAPAGLPVRCVAVGYRR
jgi:hypothetical protein